MANKVLFILHLPPPVHGSALVGGYIRDNLFIHERFNCRFFNLGTSTSVEEIGKNPAGKLLRYLKLILNVKKELHSFRPDICYMTISARGIGFYKDALIVCLVRLFDVKRVYHFHNKGIMAKQEFFFDNLLYRVVFKNADVILLSKHLYPDLKKYIPEDRVHYCPNGIPDLKREMKSNKDGMAKSIPELLFLSHLFESKGIFILVEALRILKIKGCTFHCTIIGGVGDVTEEQMEDTIKETGLTGFVNLAGKRYGDEKKSAFEMADIFVHPTFNDCLPLVLLEAMQYSLPIVSTPEGAIPDVVEDGVSGFLVPQRDAVELADKLEALIHDPDLRQKMGAAGRARYEAQFTLERFERRMVEILNQVAEKKTAGVRKVRV